MKNFKIGDMSYVDKKEYQYYKRVLGDLCTYGPNYLKKRAEDRVRAITNKYAGSESNAKN